MSAVTCFSGFVNDDPAQGINTNAYVVALLDTRNPSPTTLGTNWCAPAFHNEPGGTAQGWTAANLGQVFGITIDDQVPPNIYVAASTAYGSNVSAYGNNYTSPFGSSPFASGGAGAIYKLNGTTGAWSVFAPLPNGGPGLGNICYDRSLRKLFVSNFDAGTASIWCLDLNGTVVSTFTHSITGGSIGNAGQPSGAFFPLGDRVWAVQSHNGRLYYSVWVEDKVRRNATRTNEVWSIAIGSSSAVFSGLSRIEIGTPNPTNTASIPILPFNTGPYVFPFCYAGNWNNFGGGLQSSNPISDIAFSSTGDMMLAERVMVADVGLGASGNIGIGAHASRSLEYELTGGVWTSTLTTSRMFNIGSAGDNCAPGVEAIPGTNSAGGTDYYCDDSVATTGDRLLGLPQPSPLEFVYGLQITPPTGNAPNTYASIQASGHFVDFDPPRYGSIAKTRIGDVVVNRSCCRCAEITGTIRCQAESDEGWTGNYVYTFTITNNSGRPVTRILFPSGPVLPHSVVPVGPGGPLSPLGNGQTSNPITITINGPITGPTFSLPIIMYTPAAGGGEEVCCNITEDLTLPDCACFQLTAGPTVACVPGIPGKFTVDFTLQPLAYNIGHVFITPPTGPIFDIQEFIFWSNVVNGPTPDYVPVNILAGNTQAFQFSLTLGAGGSGTVGTTQCVEVYTHTPDLAECCMRRVCFVVPNCLGRGGTDCGSIDFNNDTSFFDPQDIDAFLSVYAEGPCVPPNATCNSIDFNSDGSLFDPCDINSFLTVYSEGPCTPCGQ